MDKLAELWSDIVKCWGESSSQYLTGALKTIELAVVATAIGCIIGLACGIIQTIPCGKNDNIVKRILLGIVKAVVRIYVEVFRGTPMIIQAIFYKQRNKFRAYLCGVPCCFNKHGRIYG